MRRRNGETPTKWMSVFLSHQWASKQIVEAIAFALGGGGGGGGGAQQAPAAVPIAAVPVARLPDVPAEEAIAALSEVSFEGSWEFSFLFTKGAFPCCALSCAPTLATTPHSARAQVYKSRLPISPHLY